MPYNYIKRKIDDELLSWAQKAGDRMPLLIRGARQVGKSSAVRHLGERFEYFLEVNFELDEQARDLFANTELYPEKLCKGLYAIYGTPIIPGKTLLFFDEIQASPRAITSLRYFYEKYGELHVAAAGSLLEFALAELPAFGVGRIQCMYMYPMNFFEFLGACGHTPLSQAIQDANCKAPLPQPVHNAAVEHLKNFLILGGMPKVVSTYVNKKDLRECQLILDSLTQTLRADFAKYKAKIPSLQISAVFDSVVAQMGKKFVYANVSDDYTHRQLKEALELLRMSGVVIPVMHTAANGVPLGAEVNPKRQKMLLLDTGIYQRLLGQPIADLLIYNDLSIINKGSIMELFVGLELMKSGPSGEQKSLYYWHREGKSSNAEVDYVVQSGWDIIPIEVKSGTTGSMQSMRLFLKEKSAPYGIRASLENYGELPDIKIIPAYGASAMSFLRMV
ncbi:MAG: ATP-binding protein [Chitinispirillia bacterium]|nr:ATP-binding protein [Chitinispirillia bacterium]MCL2267991.1 ATP-binding protein [Chitinispirillia bacterium]